jgi:hypothetical protein
MPQRTVENLAIAFDQAVRKSGLNYVFTGGIAVNAYANARSTHDLDCIIDIPDESISTLISELEKFNIKTDRYSIEEAKRDNTHLSFFDTESTLHLDCILPVSDEQHEEIFDYIDISLNEGGIRLISPERLIAYKGSPEWSRYQDLADIENILSVQRVPINFNKLDKLTSALGLTHGAKTIIDKYRK